MDSCIKSTISDTRHLRLSCLAHRSVQRRSDGLRRSVSHMYFSYFVPKRMRRAFRVDLDPFRSPAQRIDSDVLRFPIRARIRARSQATARRILTEAQRAQHGHGRAPVSEGRLQQIQSSKGRQPEPVRRHPMRQRERGQGHNSCQGAKSAFYGHDRTSCLVASGDGCWSAAPVFTMA